MTAYQYNTLGQRVSKTVSANHTSFVYDINGQLLGEYDANGIARQEFIYLNGRPIALTSQTQKVYYIHTDHLGTPKRVSDPDTHTIVWSWDSAPFGATAANDDPDGDGIVFEMNLRFAGQYVSVNLTPPYPDQYA